GITCIMKACRVGCIAIVTPASEEDPAMPTSRRQWQVLLVLTAGAFLGNLDLFIVNIAFPAIQADFRGASLSGLSWVLSGYAIIFAALLVPAGRLADLVGRKRLFLWGLGIFVAASALCAAAPGPWTLVGARVVQ